jgi:hypothetical protein
MIDAKTVILNLKKKNIALKPEVLKIVGYIKENISKELFGDIDFDSDDFFGLFKTKSLECKKLRAIEVYRFFFRFSIEKLQIFGNDTMFITLLMQYLKDEKM